MFTDCWFPNVLQDVFYALDNRSSNRDKYSAATLAECMANLDETKHLAMTYNYGMKECFGYKALNDGQDQVFKLKRGRRIPEQMLETFIPNCSSKTIVYLD